MAVSCSPARPIDPSATHRRTGSRSSRRAHLPARTAAGQPSFPPPGPLSSLPSMQATLVQQRGALGASQQHAAHQRRSATRSSASPTSSGSGGGGSLLGAACHHRGGVGSSGSSATFSPRSNNSSSKAARRCAHGLPRARRGLLCFLPARSSSSHRCVAMPAPPPYASSPPTPWPPLQAAAAGAGASPSGPHPGAHD